jgi:hypothetical protein
MPLVPITSPDYTTNLGQIINAGSGTEIDSASGAIGIIRGTEFITKAGVAAMTLALPIAGTNDGVSLSIVSTTANAHTVTTPATGLNGALHIATFAANIGSALELVAYNGSWYTKSNIGITLT